MDTDPSSRPSRLRLLPQTSRGRWAGVLLGAGVALIGVTTLLANAAGLGGSGWLALTMIPAILAVIGGGIVAAAAVVRDGERGGFAFIPLLAGLYLAFLLIGELIVPH